MGSGVVGDVGIPTYVAVSTSSYVPPTATKISGVLTGVNSSFAIASPNNNSGSATSITNPPGAKTAGQVSNPFEWVLESSNVYYASFGGNVSIACTGWVDAVNAN
jgi:hypothetical protein